MKLLLLYNRCFFGRLLWLGGKDCGVTSSRRPLYSIVVLTVYLCFINRTALSKIERKSLLRACHCARLSERNAGISYFKYPRGASSAAPCSKQIGLEWQVYDG